MSATILSHPKNQLTNPEMTPELLRAIDLAMAAHVKDARNYQAQDLQKEAAPIAARWLKARGYPEPLILALN